MIHVKNLTKEFKSPKKYPGFRGAIKSFFSLEYDIKRAIDNISFDIQEGESVGYIGVNGAGKSTTIKILSGIMVPTGGECLVNGVVPYKSRKQNASNIGVVFGQRTQLWWDLPVSESFSILQKIYNVPQSQYNQNLEYLKDILELSEFYLTPVRNLSLGQKMRADFAASMIHSPKILYLDEPTIGLDLLVKDRLRKAIRDINKNLKTTVILTTHDLDDIEEICKRIIVIDNGQIIYDGGINELKQKYGILRELKFIVRNNSKSRNINEHFHLSDEDFLETFSEEGLLIRFNKNKIDAPKIINAVIKEYDVRDISIQEPEMEEIVREIYSGKIRIHH